MSMRKMKKLCRGAMFFLFLLLMSVSLTGCAFLAALGPILSIIGSLAGVVGSIVGIFNPQVGSAISSAGGALSQAGGTMTGMAQQFAPADTTVAAPDTMAPTAVGAPTNTEDAPIIGTNQATDRQRQIALERAQAWQQNQGAPAAKDQASNITVTKMPQGTTSAKPAVNTTNPFSSINNNPGQAGWSGVAPDGKPNSSAGLANIPGVFLPASSNNTGFTNLPSTSTPQPSKPRSIYIGSANRSSANSSSATTTDFAQKPFTLSNMEEVARPLLPEAVFQKIDWAAAQTANTTNR